MFTFRTQKATPRSTPKAHANWKRDIVHSTEKHRVVKKLWADASKYADDLCDAGLNKECAIAWDIVHDYEKVMRSIKQIEQTHEDPLEDFCSLEPGADECRTYDL
jgi:hypothetical protein